jgi:hypothetical protein
MRFVKSILRVKYKYINIFKKGFEVVKLIFLKN